MTTQKTGSPGKTDILRAVILREVRVRYANRKLGYAWALFEPMAFIGVFLAIFAVIGRVSPVDEPMPVFFGSAILPWFLFINTVARTTTAVDANKALLVYPHMYPVDFMLGRTILENATCLAVMAVLLLAAWFIYGFVVQDPLQMLAAWMIVSVLGCGVGMINAALNDIVESYANFYRIFQRFLFFTSGIFFTAASLPLNMREALAWQPLLHLIDWFRSAALPGYDSTFYSVAPVSALAFSLFLVGLMVERLRRTEFRAQ